MTPPTPTPIGLSRRGPGRMQIEWSDGVTREYAATELREACPCATCREKRKTPPPPPTQLPVLSAAEAAPTTIAGMTPVGSYAYRIEFGDGHNTGLFSLELLRTLGEVVEE